MLPRQHQSQELTRKYATSLLQVNANLAQAKAAAKGDDHQATTARKTVAATTTAAKQAATTPARRLLHPSHPSSQPVLSGSAPIARRWTFPHVDTQRPVAGFCTQMKRMPQSPLRPAESASRWGTSAQIAALPRRYWRFGLCAPSPHILTGKCLTRHALIRRSPAMEGPGGSCATFDQRWVSPKV